jgi:DNA mismatch endonuclease (patch repair protein)
MADNFTKEKRSSIMSHIGGKETKPEAMVRKLIFSKGLRYRKNDKSLPGTPDIVLPKYRTVVFIHGCFWHGHKGCRKSELPDTRRDFWERKISENMTRDQRNIDELEKSQWRVIVVWQCEINNIKRREKRIESLIQEIMENNGTLSSSQDRVGTGQSLYS